MKKKLNVTTALDHPGILERLVEKLAERHIQTGNHKVKLPGEWQAIETSSTETYVSGSVTFEEASINMPFITSFVFTCMKVNNDLYTIAWSSSLS